MPKKKLSKYFLTLSILSSFSLSGFAQSAAEKLSDDFIGSCPSGFNNSNGTSHLFESYKALRTSIEASRIRLEKQVQINQKLVLTDFRVPRVIFKFIRNLHTARPVLEKINQLLTDPKLKAMRDSDSFSAMLGSVDFLKYIVDTDFSNHQDKEFAALMSEIQLILKKPHVFAAMKATADSNIDLANLDTVLGGLQLDDLLASIDSSQIETNLELFKKIESLEFQSAITEAQKIEAAALRKQLPLSKDLPFPAPLKFKGQIADSYRQLFAQEYENFLKFYDNGYMTFATSVFDENDNISASTITFDSWILPLFEDARGKNNVLSFSGNEVSVNVPQMVAIDALARTLYGEINTCEAKGIEQATLVAKIVSDRARAIKFTEDRISKNEQTVAQSINSSKALLENEESEITAASFLKSLQTSSVAIYGGKFDFGRSDSSKKGLVSHPVTQAVSRGDQFSGWRSVIKEKITIPAMGPNIPQMQVSINKELSEGDISALYNQLCPDRKSIHWQRMVNLAKSVVLDPDFSKKVKWTDSLAQEPMFYTHAVNLTFVSEIPLPNLVDLRPQSERMTPNTTVSYRGTSAACPQLRLWVSNNKQRYFPNGLAVP